jgi:FAD/FMN-containing dehydrogenase
MTELYSWGRYPRTPQTAHTVHWQAELQQTIDAVAAAHGTTLPFGNGRSYGDSCMAASDHVVQVLPLDRIIAADWQSGTITAEAGITLAEILTAAIPRGWFLTVAPGTQFVTLGGAIANDVHGKNHHIRGTFGNHVKRFSLRRKGEAVLCSPSENANLFAATIGGLGLTGVIEWAEIQLMKIRSSEIDSTVVRFDGLTEFFALSNELDAGHEYSAAWIDCLSKDGRGALIVGNHALSNELKIDTPAKRQVPVTPRWSLINGLTLRAFNEVVWRSYPRERTSRYGGYGSVLFPLDAILNWNRVYGRKGFQQYQCVIPEAAAEPAMRDLLAAIAKAGQGSCLAVLKRCGDIASPGLMSFPMKGTSLALDFPQSPSLETLLFPRLDAIVREAGGRLYPAKDAHMHGFDFRKAYPAWEKVEALRDPALNSRFWQRVIK